jgi:hypothetical protein
VLGDAVHRLPVAYLPSPDCREVLIGLLAVSAHGYVGAYPLVCLATPAFRAASANCRTFDRRAGGRLDGGDHRWPRSPSTPCVDRDGDHAVLIATGLAVFAIRKHHSDLAIVSVC